MYSLLAPDGNEKSTAKGIPKTHAKKHIRHDQYKNCLVKEEQTVADFHILQSKNHIIRTQNMKKSALSCYDDKRYLLSGVTDTLAYGHKNIRQNVAR